MVNSSAVQLMDYKRTSIFTIPEALSKTEVALTKKKNTLLATPKKIQKQNITPALI